MKRKENFLCSLIVCLLLGFMLLYGGKAKADDNKIPKIIHYVWMGSKELPEAVKKNIDTWKKHNPDFKIKRWDEESCDINSSFGAQKFYKAKAYSLASDWCRLQALKEGGIYLDTDMVVNGSFTPLLDEPLVLTLELPNIIAGCFMAVTPNHPFVDELLKVYKGDWSENSPIIWSRSFKKFFNKDAIPVCREKGKYRIVAPNILGYDFKGGENIAEHLFYANSIGHVNDYYYVARKMFLYDFAFWIPAEKKYFILKNKKEGYIYDPETDKNDSNTKKLSN